MEFLRPLLFNIWILLYTYKRKDQSFNENNDEHILFLIALRVCTTKIAELK